MRKWENGKTGIRVGSTLISWRSDWFAAFGASGLFEAFEDVATFSAASFAVAGQFVYGFKVSDEMQMATGSTGGGGDLGSI
jgi:hypothetical protein